MTKTEKLLLAVTAVFFIAAFFLLPRGGGARQTEPAFTLPAPTAAAAGEDELWVVLERRIDVNHASAEELTALPGVGKVLAGAIVAYREEHGPFASLEELLLVDGFGPGALESIRAASAPED